MKRKYAEIGIDPGRCTGCAMCVAVCHEDVLGVKRDGRKMYAAVLRSEGCTGCGFCAAVCTAGAVESEFCGLMPVFA